MPKFQQSLAKVNALVQTVLVHHHDQAQAPLWYDKFREEYQTTNELLSETESGLDVIEDLYMELAVICKSILLWAVEAAARSGARLLFSSSPRHFRDPHIRQIGSRGGYGESQNKYNGNEYDYQKDEGRHNAEIAHSCWQGITFEGSKVSHRLSF